MPRFQPFRRRAKVRAEFAAKDAKAWRRLLKAIRFAVRAPLADSKPLWQAVEACARAVPPKGHAGRDSIFLRLNLTARQFAGMPPHDRAAAHSFRPILSGLADQAEAALNAPQPPPGGRPPRADIFG